MLQQLKKFFDEKGQGIVEYALILAFVVAIAVALTSSGGLKEAVNEAFGDTAKAISDTKNGNAVTPTSSSSGTDATSSSSGTDGGGG